MRVICWVLAALSCCACAAVAQDSRAVPSGDLVPAWVFYWLLGLSTAIGSALIATIKVLWTRCTTDLELKIKEVRADCEDEKVELRKQVDSWRTIAEATEKGRRADLEAFRKEDRETMKLAMTTFHDVTTALRESSKQIGVLVQNWSDQS